LAARSRDIAQSEASSVDNAEERDNNANHAGKNRPVDKKVRKAARASASGPRSFFGLGLGGAGLLSPAADGCLGTGVTFIPGCSNCRRVETLSPFSVRFDDSLPSVRPVFDVALDGIVGFHHEHVF
jgi:hypothetical protein